MNAELMRLLENILRQGVVERSPALRRSRRCRSAVRDRH